MDGSLFAFGTEMRNAAGLSTGYWIVGAKKKPTSRLGEEAGTHRVDGGVRSAVASRLTTLPIDRIIVTHGGSWFIVSSVCVVPLPAVTVCYTLALLSGPDGRAMCCMQYA